jgi:hypothetical protein
MLMKFWQQPSLPDVPDIWISLVVREIRVSKAPPTAFGGTIAGQDLVPDKPTSASIETKR